MQALPGPPTLVGAELPTAAAVPSTARLPGDDGVAPLHFAAMLSVTDYALARRAVLRDFRRGALTRLDVCDAHPELMRAAQCIGTELDDECPVCGATNLRLVSYVYGDKLKQANGRAISNDARAREARRSRATSSPVTTSRCASSAGGTTCAGSHSTAACTRAERTGASRRTARHRRARTGTARQHETHQSSGSGTTVVRRLAVPRLGDDVDAPDEHELLVGKAAVLAGPIGHRARSRCRQRLVRRIGPAGTLIVTAGSRACPGRWRCRDGCTPPRRA